MPGKLVSLHRIDLPGDGRRNAKPIEILPKNPRRVGLTISVVNLADRTRPGTVFLATHAEDLTEQSGYPVSTTDADVFLPIAESLYALNPSGDVLTLRIIEEEA